MPEVVISDTSTLVVFQKLRRIELLEKVYGELLTTPEVAQEYGYELPSWIKRACT